jgi:hypothetical protein
VPAAIYGAGPRTVLESNAKRADEHLELDDLRRATKVVARTLRELLRGRLAPLRALGDAAGRPGRRRDRAERQQAAGEERPRLGLGTATTANWAGQHAMRRRVGWMPSQ